MNDPERRPDATPWFFPYPAGSPELAALWNAFHPDAPTPLDRLAFGWRYNNRKRIRTMIAIALLLVIHSAICILAALGKLPLGSGKGTWIGLIFAVVFALAFLTAFVAYVADYAKTTLFVFTPKTFVYCNRLFGRRSVLSIPKDTIRRVGYNKVTGALTVRTAEPSEADVLVASDAPDPDDGEDAGFCWLSGQLADWAGVPVAIESMDLDDDVKA